MESWSLYSDDFKEKILQTILYGNCAEWGRNTFPGHKKLLENIPKEVVDLAPDDVMFGVSGTSLSCVGVFAARQVQEGTIFGPVPGTLVDTHTQDRMENAWEVLDDCGHISNILKVEYHRGEEAKAWMTFLQMARHPQEQNLETYYVGGDIYYRTIKEIKTGEELLVWYAQHLRHNLGVPYFKTSTSQNKCTLEMPSRAEPSSAEDRRKLWQCVLCQKGFNSRSNLRSHMRTHTLQKPFSCRVCDRKFSQSSTLRNHMRLHTGEKPYKCNKCRSAYSQLAGLRAHQKSSQHQPKKDLVTNSPF